MYCPNCGTKIDDELEAHARHACPYCDAGLLEPTAR
jgi:DNA-directed RNA polymerase subunit RPC12/RpoP